MAEPTKARLRARIAAFQKSLKRAAAKSGCEALARQRLVEKLRAAQSALSKASRQHQAALTKAHTQASEAAEREAATSEILRVISRSQTDVQPVFDAIVSSAVRLLGGYSGALTRVVGDQLVLAALTSTDEAGDTALKSVFPQSLHSSPGAHARAIRERATRNVADTETSDHVSDNLRAIARARDYRSWALVPMIREDEAIGAIAVNRREPGGFTDDEIALLQTFANQAVIAIENARLFKELETRNREMTEALEQQTATAEILRVISASPTDVQPVFNTIAQRAKRLCEARECAVFTFDGELIHLVALADAGAEWADALRRAFPRRPDRGSLTARAVLTRSVIHVPDLLEDAEFDLATAARASGIRSTLSVPMIRDGVVVGAITLDRRHPEPFLPTQIALLQTFADQAVIALANVRLFTELQDKNEALTQANAQVSEALEQQTATAEVLKVISRSTLDLQPVLDTLIENAARLCEAPRGVIMRRDGGTYRGVAFYNVSADLVEFIRDHPIIPGRHTVTARAALEQRTIHVHDIQAHAEYTYALHDVDPIRTELGVPCCAATTSSVSSFSTSSRCSRSRTSRSSSWKPSPTRR